MSRPPEIDERTPGFAERGDQSALLVMARCGSANGLVTGGSGPRLLLIVRGAVVARCTRGPGVRRGLLACGTSGGRDGLAEAERLQDAVEVELRQAAGEVADAELVQEVLELGR
jgi:hypothetical protein